MGNELKEELSSESRSAQNIFIYLFIICSFVNIFFCKQLYLFKANQKTNLFFLQRLSIFFSYYFKQKKAPKNKYLF